MGEIQRSATDADSIFSCQNSRSHLSFLEQQRASDGSSYLTQHRAAWCNIRPHSMPVFGSQFVHCLA